MQSQSPDSTSFHQPHLGPSPPPLMNVQLHQQQQQHPLDQLYQQLNVHVIAAIQAIDRHDVQSLQLAYANIGKVLGIDKFESYSKEVKVPAEPKVKNARRPANQTTKFKKDGADLTAMLSDIGVEQKIVHVQKFLRRRRIPECVIQTLHVPKRVCDEEMLDDMLKVVDGLQEVRDNSVCEGVGEKNNSACQTVGEFVNRAVSNDLLRLNVACQTRDESMRLDVACQTSKRLAYRDAVCQTKGALVTDNASSGKIGKLARKRIRVRKGQIKSFRLGETKKHEAKPAGKKIVKEAVCERAEKISAKKEVDNEVLEAKSKVPNQKIIANQTADLERSALVEQSPTITSNDNDVDMPCKFIEWRTPVPITIDESRKPGGGIMRQKDEINSKRLAPYKIRRRLNSTLPPSNTQCSQLVINGLDPKMSIAEIHVLFCHLKSMECCSLKYDSSGNLSLGIATVAFADRVSAMKVLSHFESQMKGNIGVNMRLAATELSID